MIKSEEFWSVFPAYFNADVIDQFDADDLRRQASAMASALTRKGVDLKSLVEDLSRFLANRDTETFVRASRGSNVDWLADDTTKEELCSILQQMIAALLPIRTE